MAGLAALLSFGSERSTARTLDALSEALAPRGCDAAMVEYGSVRLLVRAALPKIHESGGIVAVVDGAVETSGLIGRYSSQGPSGLLYGQEPYALIAADPHGVVLARNLDGPPLYYARTRGAVMVASEPAALIAAGVPAVPDDRVVARYVDTGACDDVQATFFEGVRRILPDQVVEIRSHPGASGWAVRAHPLRGRPSGRITARLALLGALGAQRTGLVVLGGIDVPAAALLGTGLATRGAMPVYSTAPVGLDSARVVPAVGIDVDGFVADLGEPVPSLGDYLHWAVARATGGEVDVLVSASGWPGPARHLSRLDDRIFARYGVTLRFPLRDLPADNATREELMAVAERTLPRSPQETDARPALREVLHGMRADLAAALLYPRYGEPDRAALGCLARLGTATRAQLDRLWRLYLLQRWYGSVAAPRGPKPRSGTRPLRAEITAVGQTWQRRLITVEPLVAGDRFGDKLAWYVTEFVNTAGRKVWRLPWLLMIAAKPIAVAQGHARPVWRIEPGRLARTLARLASDRMRHRDPWSMQVAVEAGGRLAVPAAALCARFTRSGGYPRKLAAGAAAVSPPREHACPPAHLSVIGPLTDPEAAADEIMNALRRALPDEIFDTLRGCAIVSADDEAVQTLAWSGAQPPPTELIGRLCRDNPFGQRDERTPLLVALATPTRRRPSRPPRR